MTKFKEAKMLNGTLIVEAPRPQAFSTARPKAISGAEAWFNYHVERGEEGPFATERPVKLTPELARILLTRNPGNRPLSKKLRNYIKDIKEGNYLLNGDTIKISKEGLLNDGQNRCTAVVQANEAIDVFFAFGLTRDSRGTVDIGKTRTVGDILAFDGIENSNTAAAVGSLIYQYLDKAIISTRQETRPTTQQLRDFFNSDDDDRIQESIQFVGKKGLNVLGGRSILAFCHFTLKSINRPAADYFIKSLISGAQLKADSPIYLCRERLIFGRRLSVNEKAELIFRSWNAFRSNRPISKLVVVGNLPDLRG